MNAVIIMSPFAVVLTLAAGIDLYSNYQRVRRKQKTQASLSRSLRVVVATMGSFPEIAETDVSADIAA